MTRLVLGGVLAVLGAGLAGCDDGDGGGDPGDAMQPGDAMVADAAGCPPGANSCECLPDNTCNAGLSCDRGFCVPEDMADAGIPDPDSGMCTPGAEGCSCNAGTCDEGLSCVADICAPACAPGTENCNCAADGSCSGELVCENDVCTERAPPTEGLRVQGAGAKGCEVLFRETTTQTSRVGFSAGVRGEYMRRDGKMAAAFISMGGMDLGAVGGLELEGGTVASAGDVELVSSTCYDNNGRALAGAAVVLD